MTATAMVTSVFGKLGARAIERIGSMLEIPVNDVRARLTETFEDHLLFALAKCESVKTVISDESQ